MIHPSKVALLLLAIVFAAACEDTPIEPVDAADDFALALVGPTPLGVRPAPLTLPGLLHTAIHRVYTERGYEEARSLVADLSKLQSDARAATVGGESETASALLRRAHAEQLEIVLSVFGSGAAARVIRQLRADEAQLHGRIAQRSSAVPNGAHVADLLAQVADLLARAEVATSVQDALDHATRAAALLEAARLEVVQADRIPGLDEVFRAAAARVSDGSDAPQLAEYRRLSVLAEQAARGGDRQRAQTLLEATRAEQIRVVLSVFGAESGRLMLAHAREAATAVHVGLKAARSGGQDLTRLERMHAAARDILMRADTAFAKGDARMALDLGGHAVSLLNALRLALAGY